MITEAVHLVGIHLAHTWGGHELHTLYEELIHLVRQALMLSQALGLWLESQSQAASESSSKGCWEPTEMRRIIRKRNEDTDGPTGFDHPSPVDSESVLRSVSAKKTIRT